MLRVLAFNRFYLPGYQAGGPIVSLANMVAALGEQVSFFIVTSDRDINDPNTYSNIELDAWIKQGKSLVRYIDTSKSSIWSVTDIVNEVAPDVVYLNSFFDTWFSFPLLAARRLGRLQASRLMLAPRGEFSKGALAIKPLRKWMYISALRGLGLLEKIEWHASTEMEALEVRLALGLTDMSKVHIAADLGSLPALDAIEAWRPRSRGAPMRVCFLSRISPKKNLLGAIRSLSKMRLPAHMDIYGPKEDVGYWKECDKAISDLPSHIRASYRGPIAPSDIHRTFAQYDVMLLPTQGENFGHVILEAMSVGLPAIIGDRTPWKGLTEKGIGYDGPLDENALAVHLDRLAALNVEQMRTVRDGARKYADSILADPDTVEANRQLFAQ